jgi:hypothetical protein
MKHQNILFAGMLPVVFCTVVVYAASDDRWHHLFSYEKGRLELLKPSVTESEQTARSLTAISDGNIPDSAKGAVIFSALVLKQLANDRYSQTRWLVRPLHVYEGAKELSGSEIILLSPPLESGGIDPKLDLRVGSKYRILAADFDKLFLGKKGHLFIWKSSVLKLK